MGKNTSPNKASPSTTMQISKAAHRHLKLLQKKQAESFGLRNIPLYDVASNLILSTPLPQNGNGKLAIASPALSSPDASHSPVQEGDAHPAPLEGPTNKAE